MSTGLVRYLIPKDVENVAPQKQRKNSEDSCLHKVKYTLLQVCLYLVDLKAPFVMYLTISSNINTKSLGFNSDYLRLR